MNEEKQTLLNKRFEIIEKQGLYQIFEVIRDNETDVLYLAYSTDSGVAMSVLVDRNGKPLIDGLL